MSPRLGLVVTPTWTLLPADTLDLALSQAMGLTLHLTVPPSTTSHFSLPLAEDPGQLVKTLWQAAYWTDVAMSCWGGTIPR